MNINIFPLAGPAGAWPVFSDPDESRSIQANPVRSSPHVTPHLSESHKHGVVTREKKTPPSAAVSNLYLLVWFKEKRACPCRVGIEVVVVVVIVVVVVVVVGLWSLRVDQ